MLAHVGRLVHRMGQAQRQGSDGGPMRRQRHGAEGFAAAQSEHAGHLFAAAPPLAQPHAGAGQTLDLVGVGRPLAEQATQVAGVAPVLLRPEVARRADLQDVARRDGLALADVRLAARLDRVRRRWRLWKRMAW